ERHRWVKYGIAASLVESLWSHESRRAQRISSGRGGAPFIEAWYRCGLEPHINEITCLQNPQPGSYFHIRNHLKCYVYGTARPSLTLETQQAVTAAQRLVQSLSGLESLFPNGFGALARDVRSWTLG